MSVALGMPPDTVKAIVSGAVTVADSVKAIVSGAITVADSIRVGGQLTMVSRADHVPGWLEVFGVTGLISAVFSAALAFVFNSRLQASEHEHGSILALFTHRAGVLSEAQLEATRRIWKKLRVVHWDTLGLSAQHRRISGPSSPSLREAVTEFDEKEVERLRAANLSLWEELQDEKPFLTNEVFSGLRAYSVTISDALNDIDDNTQLDPKQARFHTVT